MDKVKRYIPYLLLTGLTLFFCRMFVGRYGIFGAKVDWLSQHSVLPDYFRQQFYATGKLFPEFAANLGGGQNIYHFAYYGLYSPLILPSYLLPFVKPSMVKQITGTDKNGNNLSYNETLHRLIDRETINQNKRNVLVSHQFYLPTGKKAEEIERMDSEMRTVGNIDEVSADVLGNFDYAALGHIHKPMKVGSEFYRYCGTPLACSVSEAQQQKGVVMVEMEEKGSAKMTALPLTPLHQVRVIKGTLEEVLREACGDYVTVILTDKVDLDVIDMQERIRLAFPNLLEIRRENQRKADYSRNIQEEELLDPYELCCSFLKEIDDEEKLILQDVLHTVQGVK